ncbi:MULTISPECIES: ABC1 kinase family protein [Halomonas]|uniref:ABC1 kinase family protein n=1 Tax=Halomonas TaxID=2745 RepID=UPI001C97AEC7|nr:MULTISPECIES: AarF/ABC1/UbiB kinase family protein [Halomonas]MBY6208138.1 AarF/ABC1/UbiB kinase family protein [Halomonas sp. DP3Y7-2]MBY6228947.1 AarF/ABC1/UbiB kinase family protein [Halomonas sp. DP3Y7-1]MCA0917069.1 AarF/ABC1/UbiB kinase family protein [Halomonas denitrificans]
MRQAGRTRRMLGLSVRTGTTLLRSRVGGNADWQALGESLFDGLSELKGPAMKLAQVMSQWDDLLPPELAEELARLQRNATPAPWEDIRTTLEQELGELQALFRHVEPAPFASASMGQVHLATTLEGQQVVLKVQYPGLEQVLEQDLAQVRRILRLGRWFKVSQSRLDALFDELAESLRQELDYVAEGNMLRRYRQRYDAWGNIRIPAPVDSLCTSRVLAMEYVPGTPLREIEQVDDERRQHVASTLADWLTEELFVHGEVHADPHAGNFAVDDQGRLILYDLGAVIAVPPERLRGMLALLSATLERDPVAMDEALRGLGGRQGEGAPLALYQESAEAIAPLFAPGLQDFGDVRVHRRLRELSPRVWSALDRLQPPPGMLMLARTLNGHYWNLVRLEARLDMQNRTAQVFQTYAGQGVGLPS